MKIAAGVPLSAILLSLCGCTMGPNYSRPQTPAAPTFRGADNTEAASTDASLGDQGWEQVFPEQELHELIRTALENNFDLRIAAQHVLEQQAQVRIVRSQQFPSISGGKRLRAIAVDVLIGHGYSPGPRPFYVSLH